MTTGLVADDIFTRHLTRPGHPERPERLQAVSRGIAAQVDSAALTPLPFAPANDGQILLCHSDDYLATVRRDVEEGEFTLSTGDTDICECSLDVAIAASGGAIAAVDAVMRGHVANAFCALRPPGHHATRDRGMGFCIFNHAAIAARHAQTVHGIDRVLIADWDAHHGNGTQDIFYDDPSVFYFSTHQWPAFPGTGTIHEVGTGPGRGFTLNCPLAAGACRKDVLGAFTQRLVPAMRTFKPELVVVSAGFDGRRGDPLCRLFLDDDDFRDLTVLLLEIADTYAEGRLVSVLEGGYDLNGLASAAGAHVRALTSAS